MNQKQSGHNHKILWGLVLAAIGSGSLLHYLPRLTGINELDGLLGVLFGLYICSQPAANVLNLLLYGPQFRWQPLIQRSNTWWLALNALVLLCGLTLIVIGTTRFFSKTF